MTGQREIAGGRFRFPWRGIPHPATSDSDSLGEAIKKAWRSGQETLTERLESLDEAIKKP